jgi:hypothetical protein
MIDSIEYRGRTIKIEQDPFPECPFTSWDCNPPLLALVGRLTTAYGAIDLTAPRLTKEQIKANAKRICELIDVNTLLELTSKYGRRWNWSDGTDLINSCIYDYVADLSDTDKINELPEFYKLAGIVALATSVSGYCQGHYAELLIVASKEFLDTTGATINSASDLECYADLYKWWAYGDVYGWSVEDATGEIIESCWGYFGDDHTQSGLMSAAKATIDAVGGNGGWWTLL